MVQGSTLGEPTPYDNPYAVRTVASLATGVTLAAVKAGVDDVILSKVSGIIMAHKFCTACTLDANTWLQSDFSALVDYVKTKVDAGILDVMPLGKYLELSRIQKRGPRRKMGIGQNRVHH